METPGKVKRSTKKIVNVTLGIMVFVGVISFSLMDKTHTDGELMSRLFLVFFGFIITVQIIPGLFLFGTMLKEIFGFKSKAATRK